MKSQNEEFCKDIFDKFLRDKGEIPCWCEVAQKDEPPDYYMILDNVKYAVEVSRLMRSNSVGEISLPRAAIISSLQFFINELYDVTFKEDILCGEYFVHFSRPITKFREVKGQIQESLINYIKNTRNQNNELETVVYKFKKEICFIKKINNKTNRIWTTPPSESKWEGEAAIDICNLLKERLAVKNKKLRKVIGPKIIIFYDSYLFADPKMFTDCLSHLIAVGEFHTIFIVRGRKNNFVLYSQRKDW